MGWLSPDSRLMRGLGEIADAIWINILMAFTSIPIVTVGASLSAGYVAARRSIRGEGRVTANYFRALRDNLPKATALWIPYLLVGAGLAYAWVILQITPLLIPKIAFSVLWAIGFEWTFALQARLENPMGRTFVNAFIFGVGKFGWTMALAAIDAAWLGLLIASWFYFPQGLFLLVVLGYGTVTMLHVPVFETAMRRYLR